MLAVAGLVVGAEADCGALLVLGVAFVVEVTGDFLVDHAQRDVAALGRTWGFLLPAFVADASRDSPQLVLAKALFVYDAAVPDRVNLLARRLSREASLTFIVGIENLLRDPRSDAPLSLVAQRTPLLILNA